MNTRTIVGLSLSGIVALFVVFIGIAFADHTWGGYHWARTSNPFTVKLGDSVTNAWDSYLAAAASDWSASSVLDVAVVSSGKNAKTCRPSAGTGEVCNAKYGATGWLGIAQIWVSGGHITQGSVKLNDTYFTTAKYNTSAWRNLVMCQEVGHIFGLGHQDENFTNENLNTCMDYTNLPASNQHPNDHDYAMLEQLYAHLDTTSTLAQTTALKPQTPADLDEPRSWGREMSRSRDGKVSLYARDLGGGQQVFTHVFWVEGVEEKPHHE